MEKHTELKRAKLLALSLLLIAVAPPCSCRKPSGCAA